jgi:hypothetical protein
MRTSKAAIRLCVGIVTSVLMLLLGHDVGAASASILNVANKGVKDPFVIL